jgi:dTDP-4-amino-4,6-dideoxygalactose transaminase
VNGSTCPPGCWSRRGGAVAAAVRSGWVAPLGPEVESFERELAAVTGRRHAVALSSGTSALHLGLLDLGVGAGDVVNTASLTFAATANAILYTGADPIFVDCDETGNIDVDLLTKAVGGPAGFRSNGSRHRPGGRPREGGGLRGDPAPRR